VSAKKFWPNGPAWGHDGRWAWRLERLERVALFERNHLNTMQISATKILDSDLNLFEMTKLQIVGYAGLFGWRPGYKGRYLRVEQEFRLVRQLTLNEAQNYVVEFIVNHPSVYKSGIPISTLSSQIRMTASVSELFSLL
jgi:hypothetical protein